jgi:lipopolysaccharide biosynthesis glycosyltransferase
MKHDPIHLVFALDKNFIQHCGVCLASIFQNNVNESLVIHIIYDEPNDKDLKTLKKFIHRNNHDLKIHFFDKTMVSGFKVSLHVSPATYYRLFIANLVDSEKVIYLDCDTIIIGSLLELWKTDLNDNIVGAVVSDGQDFFNAGVLLLNLNRWKQQAITAKCISWLGNNNENIQFWDQDALNAILKNSFRPLPEQWNFIRTTISESDLKSQDIRILHFVGGHKPWNFYCEHPLKSQYFKYMAHTPWKNYTIPEETVTFKIKSKVKTVLRKAGIVKK